MNKINFIFLRSMVVSDTRFQDEERDQFIKELSRLANISVNISGENVFFIETGGTEAKFLETYKNYKEPYYILASDMHNSLPAALEIATFLKNNGKKFKLFHGTVEEIANAIKNTQIKEISEKSYSFSRNSLLKDQKFAVIGKPSDWLIASNTKYEEIRNNFGAEVIDISMSEFIEEINLASDKYSDNNIFEYANNKVSKEEIIKAIKIYNALKNIISKYKLNGVTVRCFDLLDSIKSTSCLALALLNKEGIIATCEGDVPTMISMALVKRLFNQSSFQVNPSYINIEKRYAIFAHCTLPLDMTSSFKLDTHFESGIGVGIKGELNFDNITILKMNANMKNFEVFEGKILLNLNRNNLCRTQIQVGFDGEIEELFNSPNGNHLVVFYGKHKQEILEVAK